MEVYRNSRMENTSEKLRCPRRHHQQTHLTCPRKSHNQTKSRRLSHGASLITKRCLTRRRSYAFPRHATDRRKCQHARRVFPILPLGQISPRTTRIVRRGQSERREKHQRQNTANAILERLH